MSDYNSIMHEVDIMESALKQLTVRGNTFATAERDYKMALSKQILLFKAEGKPATLILNLCYGTQEIANLRMARDIAEVMLKSAHEAINVKKIKIKVMSNEYDKVWNNTNG
jgi:hypothetical protein